MHISGKILVGFVVAFAGLAIYLSAKTLAVRNQWMVQAQKNEADFTKNKETIQVKMRELDDKRGRLARTMIGWDRYWPDVKARLTQQGMILLEIGTKDGLKIDKDSPAPILHVFAINADGTSKYLGNFKVTRAGESACEARPNWLRYAGDLSGSAAELTVRVRTLVPNEYQARLGDLEQQILAAELSVRTNEDELAAQSKLQAQSEKLIDKRLSEINGDPQLADKTLPAVNVKGLLAAMADEEEARNASLAEVDRLRRELKQTHERFVETLKTNRKLAESLPQPAAVPATIGAAAR
jgi:hypothetical protein